jgi:hypothetical protein
LTVDSIKQDIVDMQKESDDWKLAYENSPDRTEELESRLLELEGRNTLQGGDAGGGVSPQQRIWPLLSRRNTQNQ